MAIIDVHAEIGTTPLWGCSIYRCQSRKKYAKNTNVERAIVASTIGNSVDFRRGNAQIARITQAANNMSGCLVVNYNYPEPSFSDMRTYLGTGIICRNHIKFRIKGKKL